MVIIRLSRAGRKKLPFYKIVVADQRSKLCGRYIEKVGFYSPRLKLMSENFSVDFDRIEYWINNGAKISDRVKSLLRKYSKINNETHSQETECEGTQNSYLRGKSEISHRKNKNHSARIIAFTRSIKSIDHLSNISLAEVKYIENEGEWNATRTSSLVTYDGTNFIEWSNRDIEFHRLHRYLLVNRNTGKLSWVRIAKTRITYYCGSIASDTVEIKGKKWGVTYNAKWGGNEVRGSNLSIKLTNPLVGERAYIMVDAWFGLSDLVIIKSNMYRTANASPLDEMCQYELHNYIKNNESEFIKAILDNISQPFKYTEKLAGIQAHEFFGVQAGLFRVRAGLLNKHPILSVEHVT